jgi:hypothetical protein
MNMKLFAGLAIGLVVALIAVSYGCASIQKQAPIRAK